MSVFEKFMLTFCVGYCLADFLSYLWFRLRDS